MTSDESSGLCPECRNDLFYIRTKVVSDSILHIAQCSNCRWEDRSNFIEETIDGKFRHGRGLQFGDRNIFRS